MWRGLVHLHVNKGLESDTWNVLFAVKFGRDVRCVLVDFKWLPFVPAGWTNFDWNCRNFKDTWTKLKVESRSTQRRACRPVAASTAQPVAAEGSSASRKWWAKIKDPITLLITITLTATRRSTCTTTRARMSPSAGVLPIPASPTTNSRCLEHRNLHTGPCHPPGFFLKIIWIR